MSLPNNLPDGPKTPRVLRLIKLIAQPLEYMDECAKTYGDTFRVWGRNETPIMYFSHPQVLQVIFSAEACE